MRLHFHDPGRLLVSVSMQSEYSDFGKKNVASEAKLYLISEPALLDSFAHSLRALSNSHRIDAELEGVDSPWTWD